MISFCVIKSIQKIEHLLLNARSSFISNKKCIPVFKSSFFKDFSNCSKVLSIECQNEAEDRTKLKKWLEMCRFEGYLVPKYISEDNINKLINMKTASQRKKYLTFLNKKEKFAKKNETFKEEEKARKKREGEERLKKNLLNHIQYGLWKNSMFSIILDQNITDYRHHMLVNSMMYGQSLVIDLSFENYMNQKERNILLQELISLIFINRKDSEPFNLTLCNADSNSETITRLHNNLPKFFPINIYSENYLDIYPKENLVYLSPDARDIMRSFDPYAVYIIGGILERGRNQPITLGKAKKEGIKIQKLPLDWYLVFKKQKSLNITVMIEILLQLQKTGDWKKALEKLPKQYLRGVRQ